MPRNIKFCPTCPSTPALDELSFPVFHFKKPVDKAPANKIVTLVNKTSKSSLF